MRIWGKRPVVDEGGITVCPNGTVSWYIDEEAGLLRMFMDAEPDPLDRRLADRQLRRFCAGHPSARELDGVLFFECPIRTLPRVAA